MENTRERILNLLRSQREVTIETLMQELKMAPATVRRHLDILQRDGYVAVRPVKRPTGRPHYAFSLTERGDDLFPQHYMRMTSRLIEEVGAFSAGETAGKTGQQLADLALEHLTDSLAKEYSPLITEAPLERRIEQALDLLASEGLAFEVRPQGDAYLILGHDCPYRRIAGEADEGCEHDQRLLGMLLNAEVERLAASGSDCAYLVRGA